MNVRIRRTLLLALLCCTAFACSFDNSAPDDESFTIVIIPDTQNAVDFTRQKAEGFAIDSSDIFIQQMQHIARKSVSNGGDVVFVVSVGDVWQHATSDRDPDHVARGIDALQDVEVAAVERLVRPEGTLNFEIPKAIAGYRLISDAGIPFGVSPGNHDFDAWWPVAGLPPNTEGSTSNQSPGVAPINPKLHYGGLNNFRMAFGSDTNFFRDKEWYVSGFEGGGSSAQIFSAGGYTFLHLAFEMLAGDDVIAWAQDVVNQFAGLPTIISTHDYLNGRGERLPGRTDLTLADPAAHNSAEELWQEFISRTDQIFMVLSGHQCCQAIRIDENAFGHEVYQVLADYQSRGQVGLDAGQPLGPGGAVTGIGDGWMREMVFYTRGATARVEVKTYSSHYERYSSELETYAEWYRNREQPDMSDEQFLAADEFTIELDDFHNRFGMPLDF